MGSKTKEMRYRSVRGSSTVVAVGYDAGTQVMGVIFKSGLTQAYHYHGVPPEVHRELMAAKSHGRFIHDHVRGRYDFDKVGVRAWKKPPGAAPGCPRCGGKYHRIAGLETCRECGYHPEVAGTVAADRELMGDRVTGGDGAAVPRRRDAWTG